MTLPALFRNHHTVWIRSGHRPARSARYALDGDRLVLFADDLADVADGAVVTAAVHEIAGGAELASFKAIAREVGGQQVEEQAIYELLDHVSLGRTGEEVRSGMERHRSTRRILALAP